MENASKALIMAAGVLIGVLILSLAVYLFVTFGMTSADLHKQIEEDRINEFNSQFTSYEGKENITIYDVITIANLATDNNISYELAKKSNPSENSSDNYIYVKLGNEYIEYGFNTIKNINDEYNKKISEELENSTDGKLPIYNCQIHINTTTRRVDGITFSEVNK